MNYLIKAIRTFDTTKDGAPLVDKRGKPFKRVFLTFDEDTVNDKDWTGGASFLDYNNDSDDWGEGTLLEGEIVKRVVGDKIFWNFYKMRPTDVLTERVQKLEDRVTSLEEILSNRVDSDDKKLPF